MEPLDKASLAEQVVEAIKRQILTHHLQPGDQLPSERQLGEILGVSRSVLREALGILVGQGIVTKLPGKGIFVQDFDRCHLDVDIRLTITDRAHLGALRDLRTILEIGMLHLVAQRITPEELDELEAMVETMQQKLAQGERVNKLDTEFHLALFKTARVSSLAHLYEQVLRDVADLTVYQNPEVMSVLTPEITMINLSYLRDMLAALRQGNLSEAERALKMHIGAQEQREAAYRN